jgi:hypothetical protein
MIRTSTSLTIVHRTMCANAQHECNFDQTPARVRFGGKLNIGGIQPLRPRLFFRRAHNFH